MLSAPQTVHLSAVSVDHVPARHGAHDDAPLSAYIPAAHGVWTLVPSHACPAGHSLQRARVVLSPPEVKKPAGHVLQLLALALRCLLSAPHGLHLLEPAGAT